MSNATGLMLGFNRIYARGAAMPEGITVVELEKKAS
jgi:hypothetical protein